MIGMLARLFRKKPQHPPRAATGLHALQIIRTELLRCIADCEGVPAARLRHRIDNAKSGQELWLLRIDAYQLVSQRHTQAVAAERINALIHCFQGVLDARKLVRIQ
jgi:hypothetical protein